MTRLAKFSVFPAKMVSLLRSSRVAIASVIRDAKALPPLIVFGAAMVILPLLGPVKFVVPLSAETSINVAISRGTILGIIALCAVVWILPLVQVRKITEAPARMEAVLKGRENL